MQPLSKEQMLTMLLYYARGYRAQDIAEIEHLSVHAVNNRLKRVKAIMECNTTTEAVVKAISTGDLVIYSPEHSGFTVKIKSEENHKPT